MAEQDGKGLVQSTTFWGAVAVIASAAEHMSAAGINANDLIIIAGGLASIWGRIRASSIIRRLV